MPITETHDERLCSTRALDDLLIAFAQKGLVEPLGQRLAHHFSCATNPPRWLPSVAQQLMSQLFYPVGPFKHSSVTSNTVINSYLLSAVITKELTERLRGSCMGAIELNKFSFSRKRCWNSSDLTAYSMNAAVFAAMIEFLCRERIDEVNHAMARHRPIFANTYREPQQMLSSQIIADCLAKALAVHGWSHLTNSSLLKLGLIFCIDLNEALLNFERQMTEHFPSRLP